MYYKVDPVLLGSKQRHVRAIAIAHCLYNTILFFCEKPITLSGSEELPTTRSVIYIFVALDQCRCSEMYTVVHACVIPAGLASRVGNIRARDRSTELLLQCVGEAPTV